MLIQAQQMIRSAIKTGIVRTNFGASSRNRLGQTSALPKACSGRTFSGLTSPPDEEYDYIVVGSGTAGSLLGNRLSADPRNKVLVLEAGPNDSHPIIHVPLGYLFTMTHPKTSWGFSTTVQPGLNDRALW